ncbi:VOC family protein [Amycolatopsis sp. NPDC059021]|uniref:VOC family protein n=1 Tax=Amycolatopsis sp. NPDC059021 TaxID=3346704 RepID=UPI00366C506C
MSIAEIDDAGQRAIALGGSLLQAARKPTDNPDGDELFAVYASPAGHPFCFGTH